MVAMLMFLDVMSESLKLKQEVTALDYDIKFDRLMSAMKANFDEEQLRDVRGRWTSAGGVQVTTDKDFLTGIPTIDNTSESLSTILVRVMEFIEFLPTMSPQKYGMAVHAAFGIAAKFADLPGVGDIERTFSLEDADPRYGLVGSIRTDVVLRNIQGDIIAIYDVKTGQTQMSARRANELREKTGALPNTPVFELNIVRGIQRKYAVNCAVWPNSSSKVRAFLTTGRL